MRKAFSEKEEFVFNNMQLFKLKQMYLSNIHDFYNFVENISFYIHFNSRNSLDWIWGNSSSVSVIGYHSSDDVEYKQIINLSDKNIVNNYRSTIHNYNITDDASSICNFFQRMYLKNKWQWLLTNKIILEENVYLNCSYNINELSFVGDYLYNKLEHTFSDINAWQKFQSLTKREKEILKLLANGNSTKEISEIYCVSEYTVKKHRENINRKIDSNKIHDLIRFADAFHLIGEL